MHPITRYRRGKGLTQGELAQALGVSLFTVQRWEKGRRPRPRHLRAIGDYLGVEPLELDREIDTWASATGERQAA